MGKSATVSLEGQDHIKSIAIPAIGCGLGGLNWEDVKVQITSVLSELDNKIEIEIYEPYF